MASPSRVTAHRTLCLRGLIHLPQLNKCIETITGGNVLLLTDGPFGLRQVRRAAYAYAHAWPALASVDVLARADTLCDLAAEPTGCCSHDLSRELESCVVTCGALCAPVDG